MPDNRITVPVSDAVRELRAVLDEVAKASDPALAEAEARNRLSASLQGNEAKLTSGWARLRALALLPPSESIDALKKQLAAAQELAARTAVEKSDLERRLAAARTAGEMDADSLGVSLRRTVDSVQKSLTELENSIVDFGIQEFDINANVGLKMGEKGLVFRFPEITEKVDPQNLTSIQLRLRAIPKLAPEPPTTAAK